MTAQFEVQTEWVHLQYQEVSAFTETYGFSGNQGAINLEGLLMRPRGKPSATLVVFMHPASTLQLLPVPRAMVQLARQHKLFLHAHSDVDAVERLFKHWPEAKILWAHSGFDRPEKVREMLRRHKNLWCDLAFRTDHARDGKVDPGWRGAFLEFPDRFMVGTDSYTPERWHYIGEHANWSRQWLADLPRDVAERIAWKNGETLFGGFQAH